MGKFIKWSLLIITGIVALAGAAFIVITYWQRILSYAVAAKHLGSNVIKTFSTEKPEEDDANDYYDI